MSQPFIEPNKIQLVLRNEDGREITRQQFNPDERERAERIMVARNYPEVALRSGLRWGIETEEPAT